MTLRRSVAVALACAAGLSLGSCTSFSGYVSDTWPHFAGGEPNDLPPRPGTPGYDQFISHGQAAQGAAPPASTQPAAANAQPPVAGTTATVAKQPPAAAAETPSAFAEPPAADTKPPLAPAITRPADDPSAVQGGLY